MLRNTVITHSLGRSLQVPVSDALNYQIGNKGYTAEGTTYNTSATSSEERYFAYMYEVVYVCRIQAPKLTADFLVPLAVWNQICLGLWNSGPNRLALATEIEFCG